ncbi:MAG: phosphoglycerate kinase [bacterium]|nr:phosphoglycerate kinase [bacterium]
MNLNLKTLKEVDIKGKKVLLRVAYDITLQKKDGAWIVPDDLRIRATLPTINYLLEQNCSLGILSWLKRPAGKVDPDLSLSPIAVRLSELLSRPVEMLPDCVGPEVEKRVSNLEPGEIIMLENVRFHPEEEKNDPEFAKQLTAGFDFIVYDAFGQAHRIHSSTTGILEILPSAAGFLFEKEINFLSELLQDAKQPFVVVLGGAKISDKVETMRHLLGLADKMLIGGALANTFMLATGQPVGKSSVEDIYVNVAKGEKKNYVDLAKEILEDSKGKVLLPLDFFAAASPNDEKSSLVNIDQGEKIPSDKGFYDIGPRTINLFEDILKEAKTIFMNGPMGFFEKEIFATGTKKISEAVYQSGAVSIVGGGDTESIVSRYGWEGRFTHVSTGGGASLEFLAGHEFPVMKYLIKP